MKIYLASYLEPKNHGSGNLYAIAPTKPDNLQVFGAYTFFIPDVDVAENYKKKQLIDQAEAADYFNKAYQHQLDAFLIAVQNAAKEENKDVKELLPFMDEDTLLSWERSGYTSYRPMVAEVFKKLGYEVVLN